MPEITGFIKGNTRYPDLPEEDSFKYLKENNKIFLVVADGITRDPIGMEVIPDFLDAEGMKEFLKKYPRPSPAKTVAEIFCEKILKHLNQSSEFNEEIMKSGFEHANKEIKEFNEEYFQEIDYLENDYAGCVASAGIINGRTLIWGFIGDCGLCVFNKKAELKFKTPDEVIEIGRIINSQGRDWKNPEWRGEARRKYRNNPGRTSYGALTGEEEAMRFVKAGTLELESGDMVILYSDGMDPLISSEEFKKNLQENGINNLKEFCIKESLKKQEYEREGTLVATRIE